MAQAFDPILSLSALILPWDSAVTRLAPRPASLQHASYMRKFDAHTVIYDLFRTEDPTRLIAICPPLFNLAQDLELAFFAEPGGVPCPFTVDVRAMTERVILTVPEGCAAVSVQTCVGTWRLVPSPSMCARFAGTRAIMTLSQDNDLQWIRDWVVYHAHAQGATAAVIYDNGSTRYDPAALSAALEGTGVDHAVIPWPYRYGPNDHRMPATRRVFDSNFCQTSMLDHAWQRLFARAASVVNADIDELIYTEGGSVFERAEGSAQGFLRYTGRWVEPLPIKRGRAPRHRDFWRTVRTSVPLRTEPKWVVAPPKVPEAAQWMVHDIAGMTPDASSEAVSFGHFRGINSAFTVDAVGRRIAKRTWAIPLTPTRPVKALRRAMDAAFADDLPPVDTPPRAGVQNPIAAFNKEARDIASAAETDPAAAPYFVAQAMSALREYNDRNEMRAHAERAFKLAPEDPNAQEVLAASCEDRLATLERIAATPAPERADLLADRLTLLAYLAQADAPDQAAAYTAEAKALVPDLPGALLIEARLADAVQDTERAVARFARLVEVLPERGVPLARQRAYYDPQTRSFRVVFDPCGLHSIAPRLPLRALAQGLLALERFEEAVAPARKLAAREPFVFVSQMFLARTLRRAGDTPGAKAAADAAAHAARVTMETGTNAILFRAKHRSWSAARLVEIGQAQLFSGDLDALKATAAEIRAIGRPGRAALAQLRKHAERHPKGKAMAGLI